MIYVTKHKNNKLYVPQASRYTNLDEIKTLVQSGETITVTEHETGIDITAHILSQVLVRCNNIPAAKIAELIRREQ